MSDRYDTVPDPAYNCSLRLKNLGFGDLAMKRDGDAFPSVERYCLHPIPEGTQLSRPY
jgi:hypothetical protein